MESKIGDQASGATVQRLGRPYRIRSILCYALAGASAIGVLAVLIFILTIESYDTRSVAGLALLITLMIVCLAGVQAGQTFSAKQWSFRMLAVGIPLVIGAMALVFVDRTRPIYLEESETGYRFVYDQFVGWRNIPNRRSIANGRRFSINSKGLRGRELPYEKRAETTRILILGDSFAWGYGVADDEVFSEVLQDTLQGSDTKWEILNAAVSGWGTDQAYLFLVNEGFKYEPEIVVLACYVVNDPVNNSYSMQNGNYKPVFLNTDLELANVPVPKPRIRRPLVKTNADPVELTVAIIAKMAEACLSRGGQFVLMKFGMFTHVNSGDDVLLRRNEQFVELVQLNQKLKYLDLDDAFAHQGLIKEDLLKGNDGFHWNALGHRQTASILYRFLVNQGLASEILNAEP